MRPRAFHSYPVSFTRGGTVSAGVVFTIQVHEDVADPDAFVSSLWISGEGGGVGELSGRFEGQTSWSPVPDKPRQYHVWLSATASHAEGRLAPLGEKIDAGKLETRWRLNRLKAAENKTIWSERSAVNRAYVTGAAAADAFHTVVDIGCRGGKGKSPATDAGKADIVKGVWKEFADPTNGVQNCDGNALTYYRAGDQTPVEASVSSLLSTRDGRCGAWASLLVTTLNTQGIVEAIAVGAADMPAVGARLQPPTVQGYIPGRFDQIAVYAIVKGAGQGNPTPKDRFVSSFRQHDGQTYGVVSHVGFHVVVKIPGIRAESVDHTIYDPSYGRATTGVTITEAEDHWEEQAVRGWFLRVIDRDDAGQNILRLADGPAVDHRSPDDVLWQR